MHRPLCGNLAVSLVADLPNQDLDLDAAQIQAWNADFDVLLQRARTNLLARGERKFREVLPGCYRSAWQDGLDGSRILLPGILQGLKLTGDPVAVLPGRDTLLVTGSGDDQGLVWLLESLLAHLALDGEATDATPLRYRNLGWEPLQLPEDHPAAALLTRLQARRGAGPAQAGCPRGLIVRLEQRRLQQDQEPASFQTSRLTLAVLPKWASKVTTSRVPLAKPTRATGW